MKLLMLGMILMALGGCNYSVDKPGGSTSGSPLRAPEGTAGNGDAVGGLDTRLSFANVFAVAIRTNCFGCHASPRNAGGINLETYESAFSARQAVAEAVSTKYMPESKGRVMPDDQRALLLEWIAAGAPRDGVPTAGSAPAPSPSVSPAPNATPGDCDLRHDDDDHEDDDCDSNHSVKEFV